MRANAFHRHQLRFVCASINMGVGLRVSGRVDITS